MALEQRIKQFLNDTLTNGDIQGLKKVLRSPLLTREMRNLGCGFRGVLGQAVKFQGSNIDFITLLFEGVFEHTDPGCRGLEYAIEGRHKDLQELFFPHIRPHQANECLAVAASTSQLKMVGRLAEVMPAGHLARFMLLRMSQQRNDGLTQRDQRAFACVLAHCANPQEVVALVRANPHHEEADDLFFKQWEVKRNKKDLQGHVKAQKARAPKAGKRKM